MKSQGRHHDEDSNHKSEINPSGLNEAFVRKQKIVTG